MEGKIQIILRFHITQVRMATRNKTNDSTLWQGCRKPLFFLVEIYIGTASLEIYVEIPQKAENQSNTRSSYTTHGFIHKGLYILLQRYLIINVHCCSIYNSQKLETA